MNRNALALGCLTFLFAVASVSRAAHVFEGFDLKFGKDVSLLRDDPLKKGTVLIFMSANCPCSMSHADEIKKLSADFTDFRFIGINSNADESNDTAKSYFASFPFTVLKDSKSKIADELKALKTPHAFIFTSDGKQVFQGGVSNSSTFQRADRKYLREALADLASGNEVRTPRARALGCAVDRSTR